MTEVPEADRSVGMLVYGTTGEPCAGKAKSADEDFEVSEKIDIRGMVPEKREGYFPVYRVEKRSIDTLHLEREVSSALKSRVSFGGLKDKRSASVQYFTPTSTRARAPEELNGERYSARVVGYVPSPMMRSAVLGNEFRIVLRGCCPGVGQRASEAFAAAREKRMPNFYGMQRFGARGSSHRV
ncbi:MAG TPA: tRNA pseudouridine(13) synthase TruD, partial [Nitrososphaerales archaeon]|nr:tRNA pseudouridine(13) synthase TruD [Nitrososphaerales archaeon]